MRLNNLKPRPGAKHRTKRLGCGESSGLGKTCGRGHKGQKARSGGGVRIGFEGGQMPIFRRLPKKGFSNVRFATVYGIANLDELDARFEDGATVDESALRASGIINGRFDGVKILGTGDVSKKLNIVADKVSKSAREKIEKAGGSVTIIEKPIREKGVKAPGREATGKPAAATPAATPAPAPEAAAEGDSTEADA